MILRQDITDIFVGFGARLRAERLKVMKTQDEFAALADTSGQTQMRYETGKTFPKLEYLYELAAYGIDIGYIVTGRRDDGSLDALDSSLLDKFKALNDEQKVAIVHLLGVMSDQPTLNADNLSTHQGRTLHSPALTFRAKPKDFE